ncbi:hypothetical protein JYT92_00565 [bacterium AH-315-L15]|nr:hypothetical protein [bacterium AH-315-L15]
MKIYRLFAVGILSVFLLVGPAFAQNIQTDTTMTTVGSTQFGFAMTPAQLATVMQATVAPDCGTGRDTAGLMTCDGGVLQGLNDAFVRISAMPGSHTGNPFGTISTLPNFACGPAARSGDCSQFDSTPGPGGTQGPGGANQFVGDVNIDIDLGGVGTPGMPQGFMRFTLNATANATTIDQFQDHTISLGAENMVFRQRAATIGLGNPIPDPIGGPLTLVSFDSIPAASGLPTSTGMVTRLDLDQGNADGFGALNLDQTFDFPAGTNSSLNVDFPDEGSFVTPGLAIGGTVAAPTFDFP